MTAVSAAEGVVVSAADGAVAVLGDASASMQVGGRMIDVPVSIQRIVPFC